MNRDMTGAPQEENVLTAADVTAELAAWLICPDTGTDHYELGAFDDRYDHLAADTDGWTSIRIAGELDGAQILLSVEPADAGEQICKHFILTVTEVTP